MIKMVTRYYYTLKEIFDINLVVALDDVKTDGGTSVGLGAAVAASVDSVTGWASLDNTQSKKMFTDYLWPEFQNAAVLYIDVECGPWEEPVAPEDADIIEAFEEVAPQWMRWLQESYDKYSLILSSLTTASTKLMDQLGSSSLVLYNDTPQAAGDFATDNHVTNATRTSSSADVATPIARLQEIQSKIRSYYADWANEFARFVILSA